MTNSTEELQRILNKNKIGWELFLRASMDAVGSLIFMEFITKSKSMDKPVRHIKIPPIRRVREIVSYNSPLMKGFANGILNGCKVITDNPFWDGRKDQVNYRFTKIFDNPDEFNAIFASYVLPNIQHQIPATIVKKFGLDSKQQLFREDDTIDMFNRKYGQECIVSYIIEETILHFSMSIGLETKEIDPENIDFDFTDVPIVSKKNNPADGCSEISSHDVYVLMNKNAISPIFINTKMIMENQEIRDLISRATKTTFEFDEDVIHITTSNQNDIEIIRLED